MPPPESSRRSHSHRPRDRDRDRERDRRKNGQRKRKSQSSRRPVSGSEDNRDRSSRTLSANALADLERENARQKKRSERASRGYKDESRRRERRDEHRKKDRDLDPDRPRTHGKHKKKRVVSGAIMEEGRSKTHLRGGWGSVDSVEQEKDFYLSKPPKKSKKKLCKL